MKSYGLSELSKTEVDSLKARPCVDFSSIFSKVQPIVDHVCNRGDAAVSELVLLPTVTVVCISLIWWWLKVLRGNSQD